MVCSKIEKTAGTGSFHNIMHEEMPTGDGSTIPIVKKMNDILGINVGVQRKRFAISEQICKKCLRALIDIVQQEEKLREKREEIVGFSSNRPRSFSTLI